MLASGLYNSLASWSSSNQLNSPNQLIQLTSAAGTTNSTKFILSAEALAKEAQLNSSIKNPEAKRIDSGIISAALKAQLYHYRLLTALARLPVQQQTSISTECSVKDQRYP